MTITTRIQSPAHFLAVVPELLGFEPVDSLVLVGFEGKASCGAARIDLPRAAKGSESDDEIRRAVAARAVDTIARVGGADGVVAVVYTSASCRPEAPQLDLLAAVGDLIEGCGLRLRNAHFIASDGWGEYGAEPRPLEELTAEVVLRRLDPDAHELRPNPRTSAAIDECGVFEGERTARALATLRTEAVHGGGGVAAARLDPVWFAAYSATWKSAEVGPSTAALAAFVLADDDSRDVALATWVWGEERGHAALDFHERRRRGEPAEPNDDPAAMLMGCADLPRPSVEAVEHITGLLREVAARLPRSERTPVLTVLAWLSWAIGRASLAGRYAELACEGEPDAELPTVLLAMLRRGILPDWVFRSPDRPRRSQRRRGQPGGRSTPVRGA